MRELEGQIKVVVGVRLKVGEAEQALRSARTIWEIANHSLFEEVELAKIQCGESEQLLRELTLQAYAETGNKAPAVGVGIRVKTILGYLLKDAMEWAMEHKLALKLDSAAFEKIAKTSNLPFVTRATEPIATIATDLAKAK